MIPVVIQPKCWAVENFSFAPFGGSGCHALSAYLSENPGRLAGLAAGRTVVLDPPGNPFIFKAALPDERSICQMVERVERVAREHTATGYVGGVLVTLSEKENAIVVRICEGKGFDFISLGDFLLERS